MGGSGYFLQLPWSRPRRDRDNSNWWKYPLPPISRYGNSITMQNSAKILNLDSVDTEIEVIIKAVRGNRNYLPWKILRFA